MSDEEVIVEENIEQPVDNLPENSEKAVVEPDLTALRDARCEPVASEIIQILAKHNPTAKKISFEEAISEFSPIGAEINQLMKDSDFSISDVTYTWSIVQSVIDMVKRMSNDAVQIAFDTVVERLLEVDSAKNLSLQKLDNMLQSK